MPRLLELGSTQEFVTRTESMSGVHVLTGAVFDAGEPEAIRLNLATPNASCVRANGERLSFSRPTPPFELAAPAVLLSSQQVRDWQRNFVFAEDTFAGIQLGDVSQTDERNIPMLHTLQCNAEQFLHVDRLMRSDFLDSQLLHRYMRHPNSLRLVEDEQLTKDAGELITAFDEACSRAAELPELRDYLVQADTRVGNLGPHGEQFREWLAENSPIENVDGHTVEFVAYNLCSARIAGPDFRWERPAEVDLRSYAVDLLLCIDGMPVWTEVKMVGDRWTSSALQQILLYGSMHSGSNQRQRRSRAFPQFDVGTRDSLGVLVECRDDERFQQDYEQTVEFARTTEFGQVFKNWFDQLIFMQVRKSEAGWEFVRMDVI